MVGSGDRSDKIRTYILHKRVTNQNKHTVYNLTEIVSGIFFLLQKKLRIAENAERMKTEIMIDQKEISLPSYGRGFHLITNEITKHLRP